jgi:hypothetical protein
MTLRAVRACILVLIVALIGLLLTPFFVAIEWIGEFRAQVQIDSARTAGIREIAYDTWFWREDVEESVRLYREAPIGDDRMFWDFTSDKTFRDPGHTLVVRGRAGGRGDSTRYAKFIILRITFDDGVTLYRWAELDATNPDRPTVITIPAEATN